MYFFARLTAATKCTLSVHRDAVLLRRSCELGAPDMAEVSFFFFSTISACLECDYFCKCVSDFWSVITSRLRVIMGDRKRSQPRAITSTLFLYIHGYITCCRKDTWPYHCTHRSLTIVAAEDVVNLCDVRNSTVHAILVCSPEHGSMRTLESETFGLPITMIVYRAYSFPIVFTYIKLFSVYRPSSPTMLASLKTDVYLRKNGKGH